MHKYEKLFKIKHFKRYIYTFNVYRRNFFGKLELVAKVRVIPGEKSEITYIKKLKYAEEEYIENYFEDLSRLKIELKESQDSIKKYIIYRKNYYNDLEEISSFEINPSGYTIHNSTLLKPYELLLIQYFIRNNGTT